MLNTTRHDAATMSPDQAEEFGISRMRELAKGELATVAELMEVEETARQFAPSEEWIAGFNENPDSESVWEAFEAGLASAAEDEGIAESDVLNWEDVREMYEELLDESMDTIKIGDLEYDPSRVLKAVDPVAFGKGLSEYADSLHEDGYRIDE